MKRRGRRTVAAIPCLALALVSSAASAEPTTEDKAAAETLFDEAVALVGRGEIAPACERFAESQRRDPQLGTLLYLATCHEQQGRTATAWVEFKEALSQAEQANKADRIKQAQEGSARVEAVLSRVRLRVAEAAPGQVVTVNGREVRTFDAALPYDPGTIAVEASAPARQPFTTTITLGAGPVTTDIDIPALAPASVTRDATEPEASARDRTLAYVVGGAGLGIVALGFAFGGVAMAEQSAADESCNGRFCDQEGLDGHERANAFAWASNISIGVGAAAVATGVVLFFVGPEIGEPERTQPARASVSPVASFGPEGAMIGAGGVF